MTSNLKVLQVIPKLGYGGAETGCYDIAHYLAEKNFKVVCLDIFWFGNKLNKKVKEVARKSVLSSSLKADKIIVLEDLTFDKPKTTEFLDLLKGLKLEGKRVTLVTSENNSNVYLSSRNIQKIKVVAASDVNTYDLLNCSTLVLTEGSVKAIENSLS